MNNERNQNNDDRSAEEGAKWYAIFFLLIVPALGFTILAAVIWSVFGAMFK